MICRAWRIARGDDSGLESLLSDMEYNCDWGCYSVFGCQHKPPCEQPTKEQAKVFDERFARLMRERGLARAKRAKSLAGPESFTKFVAPVIANMQDAPMLSEIFSAQPLDVSGPPTIKLA